MVTKQGIVRGEAYVIGAKASDQAAISISMLIKSVLLGNSITKQERQYNFAALSGAYDDLIAYNKQGVVWFEQMAAKLDRE